MRQLVSAVGGPSTADLLKAIEWGGSSEQPLLVFRLDDGRFIEALVYRVVLVMAAEDFFVVDMTSTDGEEFELIWEPKAKVGRCLTTQTL